MNDSDRHSHRFSDMTVIEISLTVLFIMNSRRTLVEGAACLSFKTKSCRIICNGLTVCKAVLYAILLACEETNQSRNINRERS